VISAVVQYRGLSHAHRGIDSKLFESCQLAPSCL